MSSLHDQDETLVDPDSWHARLKLGWHHMPILHRRDGGAWRHDDFFLCYRVVLNVSCRFGVCVVDIVFIYLFFEE